MYNGYNVLHKKFDISKTEAIYSSAWIFAVGSLVAMIVGDLTDRIGKRPQVLCLGTFSLLFAVWMLAFLTKQRSSAIVFAPIIFKGLSLGCFGGLVVTCVALLENSQYHGIAFGIVRAAWAAGSCSLNRPRKSYN